VAQSTWVAELEGTTGLREPERAPVCSAEAQSAQAAREERTAPGQAPGALVRVPAAEATAVAWVHSSTPKAAVERNCRETSRAQTRLPSAMDCSVRTWLT
jgi:hypothetical protein